MIKLSLTDRPESNQLMPVTIGKQDVGKTELFRRLLPIELKNFYAEFKIQPLDENFQKSMANYMLIMDDEMDSHGPKDAEALKAVLTSKAIDSRPLFTDLRVKLPRRASLCGTGNNPQVLSDPTGNRRLLPIEITSIDFNIIDSVDRKKMIAEASLLLDNGYDIELSSNDKAYLSTAYYIMIS